MIDALIELIRSIAPAQIAVILVAAVTAVVAYIRGERRLAARKYLEAESGLRELIESQLNIPSPETAEVDRGFIDEALQDTIPAYDGTNDEIHLVLADGVYRAPYDKEIGELLLVSQIVQYLPYRPEVFDCENFAGLFKELSAFFAGSNTVGTVHDWSGGHAYNVIVTAEGNVLFYEPGDDKMVSIGEGDYELSNAMIIM